MPGLEGGQRSEELRIIFAAEDRYTSTADAVVASMDQIAAKAGAVQQASAAMGQRMDATMAQGGAGAAGLQRDLAGVSGQAQAAGAAATGMGQRVQAGTRTTGVLGLTGAFGTLAAGIGTAATAVGALSRGLDTLFTYGSVGAQMVNLERSFERFTAATGESADAVLTNMQRMSNGMLTETQAMQQYNRAYLLMGAEMAAKMPELIQIATAASAAGMGEFSYMLNSLVIGLGRTSPLILDNLGFTVKLEEAYNSYAASLGKAAGELSKAEQQQALLTAIMSDAQRKFGDLDAAAQGLAGAGITQLRTQVADLREEIARLASGPIGDVATSLSRGLTEIGVGMGIDALSGNARIIEQMQASVEGYNKRVEEGASFWERLTGQTPKLETMRSEVLGLALGLDVARLSAEDLAAVMALLEAAAPGASAEFRVLREEAFRQRDAVAELHGQSLMTADALREMGGGARRAEVDLKGLNAVIGSAIALANDLAGAAAGAGEALAGMATDMRVSVMRAMSYAQGLTQPQLKWYTTGKEAWELPEAIAEYGRALGSWFEGQGRQIWTEHNQGISAGASGYGALQSAMESYYESWRSQAQGVLAPTQDFDLGALTEEVYGYQDKWDEAARRAMDVVKRGGESPWAAQMGLGGKEEALQYVKDFYAGLLPEEVNWEAAIGQYQAQMEGMLGQQNLGAMFEEKLIGAGWGPDNAAVALALEAPFAPAGTDSAAAFAGSFSGYDWATMGTDTGELILTGLRQRMERGDAQLTSSIESLVISTVRNYISAGGTLP